VDFGGNLEVSPPIPDKTEGIKEGAAGPEVKAHRRAPFGKIILGDSKDRPCQPEFRRFLIGQKVQPVLPLDTSWLAVGHVDEFMTFIRSQDARGFKVPFASIRAMNALVREILTVDRATTIHAGCYEKVEPRKFEYAEAILSEFFDNLLIENNLLSVEKVRPIQFRVQAGLNLNEEDILPIPMLFKTVTDPIDPDKTQFVANTVGTVNMLVVDNVLLVPRPFGPRMTPEDAEKVLKKTFESLFGKKAPEIRLPSPNDMHFWVRPGESLHAVAMYFARPNVPPVAATGVRRQIIERLKEWSRNNFDPSDPAADLTDLGPEVIEAVRKMRRAILDANIGSGVTPAVGGILENLDAKTGRFDEWMRLRIPVDTVDVMEGYLKSVLEPTGNLVHFVSAFESLHEQMGEVHCGTNAIRQNPEADPKFKDRWWDKGLYDPDFDASYRVRSSPPPEPKENEGTES
jgi:hypothetical protein